MNNKEILKKVEEFFERTGGHLDYKEFFIPILFYRFISEDMIEFLNQDKIDYAKYSDDEVPQSVKDNIVRVKGYFISPSQLFSKVVNSESSNLGRKLIDIFNNIELSSNGYESKKNVRGIFSNFISYQLGQDIKQKNQRLEKIIKEIDSIKINFSKNKNIFGDIYDFLLTKYSSIGGVLEGGLFTPLEVSKLIMKLAIHNQENVGRIYDPACGSGSLLSQTYGDVNKYEYFGQEINPICYNLSRMNMFFRGINYTKFNIESGDTLINPSFRDKKPFDVIVSNPPYSTEWIDNDEKIGTLSVDERFINCPLAPKLKGDFAFVLHCLNYLSDSGRAVMVCFPGALYRGGVEQKIRKYIVDGNYVEAVIPLPSNLFYHTSSSMSLLLLSKNKPNTDIQFINANGRDFFERKIKSSVVSFRDDGIEKVIKLFADKKESKISKMVSLENIQKNDYNLHYEVYLKDEEKIKKEIEYLKSVISHNNKKIELNKSRIDFLNSKLNDED